MTGHNDYITPQRAATLAGLFRVRVNRSPKEVAYRHFDRRTKTWRDVGWEAMANIIGRWQAALQKEELHPGDRIGLMLPNGLEWIICDQAALGLGLVTVPLYTNDRPENVAYIVREAGIKMLLVEGQRQWKALQQASDGLPSVRRIVCVNALKQDLPADPRLLELSSWIKKLDGRLQTIDASTDDLATIVYTSGTTGRPKGVMLSHNNILQNAYAAASCGVFTPQDVFLSFLPLSHALERTAGYYMSVMVGAQTAFARSVQQLGEDLRNVRPTVLISVPRIYEMVYARVKMGLERKSALTHHLLDWTLNLGWQRFQYQQGRATWSVALMICPLLNRLLASKIVGVLGGRLKFAICGGAALPPDVGRFFISLGVPLFQGYGMTEASPVVSVNRPDDNIPESIGLPLPGVDVKLGPNDELLTRSSSVMLGYWNNEQATRDCVDEDGWLHTGDQARIDAQGHIFITGRLKDIIVLANGEKVPPADMEMAIGADPLFSQTMVVGEAKPYLVALTVLDSAHWRSLAEELALDPHSDASLKNKQAVKAVLARIAKQLQDFPGYAQIRRVSLNLQAWTVEEGLLTPTQKIKRAQILTQFADEVKQMYTGHAL